MQSIMQLEYVLFETLFRNISNDNCKIIKRLENENTNPAVEWSVVFQGVTHSCWLVLHPPRGPALNVQRAA